jgi:hypothetical protein
MSSQLYYSSYSTRIINYVIKLAYQESSSKDPSQYDSNKLCCPAGITSGIFSYSTVLIYSLPNIQDISTSGSN